MPCTIEGCARPVVARGMCKKHWQQWYRKGVATPDAERPGARSRLIAKVRFAESGCWIWQGSSDGGGYGMVRFNGRLWRAHRASYVMFRGAIPSGMVLDHVCRNRACVNPDHLEAVTQMENMHRGWRATKPLCPKGHPYSGDNLRIELRPDGTHGKRICKACRREVQRRRREGLLQTPEEEAQLEGRGT